MTTLQHSKFFSIDWNKQDCIEKRFSGKIKNYHWTKQESILVEKATTMCSCSRTPMNTKTVYKNRWNGEKSVNWHARNHESNHWPPWSTTEPNSLDH